MITSFFRCSRLWETEENLWLATLQRKVSPEITKVGIERRFLIDSARPLEDEELNKLKWLLTETFEPEMFKEQSAFQKNILEVGPRLVIVTPESTNAVSICSACGLDSVKRIEQTRLFSISLENGSDLSTIQRQKVYGFIYDRMTEQPYLETPRSFDQDIRPEPVQLIRLLESGIDVLKDANEKLGLALDKQMMQYILGYYQKMGRNPTDVELFMSVSSIPNTVGTTCSMVNLSLTVERWKTVCSRW